jgi:hypothetical protein
MASTGFGLPDHHPEKSSVEERVRLLWRDRVIGWGNVSVKDNELKADFGYVASPPRDRAFKRELDAELDRMRAFLRVKS